MYLLVFATFPSKFICDFMFRSDDLKMRDTTSSANPQEPKFLYDEHRSCRQ
jgi:hypothetical protein